MKRSCMLLFSILFVVALLKEKTEGRETPYYLRDVNNTGAVESEDHPWGGDGSGIQNVSPGKGTRPIMVGSQAATWRFDIWLSQMAFRWIISPKSPNATPTVTNPVPPPQNTTSSKGGAN